MVYILHACEGQKQEKCGKTSITDLEAGSAKISEFPSMCTIFLRRGKFNVFAGAASLISSNQLLTLASGTKKYFEDKSTCNDSDIDLEYDIRINCGSDNLKNIGNDEQIQRRKVKKIFIHPEFDEKSLINDLAIILVDEDFEFTDSVSPVCLPEKEIVKKDFPSCIAVGHGKDFHGDGGFYSENLKKTDKLPLWDLEDCENKLNEEYFERNHSLTWSAHSSFLCAGGELDVDTCEGDGGGPLVCLLNENYDAFDPVFDDQNDASLVQIGVTAWGIECGMERPSVYSSVFSGRCWIDQIMTCYQGQEAATSNDIFDLRSSDGQDSVGGLTSEQCGEWLKSAASEAAACGCKQKLVTSNNEDEDALDLRENSLGLRTNS